MNYFAILRNIKNINLNISENSKKIIAEIEKIRQKITNYTKINFRNDIILDKGEAWGATIEDTGKAQKEYPKISNKINESKIYLQQLTHIIHENYKK